MLKLTASFQTPAPFFMLKRFRKAEFLLQGIFGFSANTTRILSGLVFDYLECARDLEEYIYPSLATSTNAKANNSVDGAVISRAFKELSDAQLIDITKKGRIFYRITPLYFVLFDVCSCFDPKKESYLFISDLRRILKSAKDKPKSIEEAIQLFMPLINKGDNLASRSKILSGFKRTLHLSEQKEKF